MGSRKIIRSQKILIADIVIDEDLYPRTQTYWQVIFDYSESLKAGAKFPPITIAVFKGKKLLVDGRHRLESRRLIKLKDIQADVLIGLNRKEIFTEAIKRNIKHGKVLSPFEKRKLVLKLRTMKYKPDEISELIQVPLDRLESFVASNLISSITGEQIITKAPLGHLAGKVMSPSEITKLEKAQKKLSIGVQLSFLRQLRDLLKSKLINRKNSEIAKLIEEIKTLI